MVNESVNPTLTGGIADSKSYKARRLYKAPRWDRERNSQRWGTMTFMEAEPVSDRRYFGTDDSLDPEQAPPINDREPARRIYYILNDTSAFERSPNLEYSDRLVSLMVNPWNRGYGLLGARWFLEGGVPVLGSLNGPGKYGSSRNFGNLNAGKAQVIVDGLFVPESDEQGFTLSYKTDSHYFLPGGASRTPLLENHHYTFSLKGLVGADKRPLVFDTVCIRDPQSGKLVLSCGAKNSALEEATVQRAHGATDEVALADGGKNIGRLAVGEVLAVSDESGRYYAPLKDFTLLRSEKSPATFKIEWTGTRPVEGAKYQVIYSCNGSEPTADINPSPVLWRGGPVASGRLVGCGSYKYKPGEEPIRELKSGDKIQCWDIHGADGVRLYFGSRPIAVQGFTIGMVVKGGSSGAAGMVKAFGNDGTREYVTLSDWNLQDFKVGEGIVPEFNTASQLGVNLPAMLRIKSGQYPSNTIFDAVFASDNPVAKPLSLKISRTAGAQDVISLSAGGSAPDKKDYYPWKVVKVSGTDGIVSSENLDFISSVDARNQTVVLKWGDDWPGKSPLAKAPIGGYQVELLYFAGSPTFENLPWPEWRALTKLGSNLGFKDPHFLTAKNGRIVTKGSDGLVAGSAFLDGRDYTVAYDESRAIATVQWKPGIRVPSGNLYIQYRKAVDDYDHVPWGSPKHLSGQIQNAVLVDAYERFMGNFGFIHQSVNFPGYPPAVAGEVLDAAFRKLWIGASGAVQSTSGAINLRHDYNGKFEDLQFVDTNYGLLMPINLYYPWQNNGVRDDGSLMLRVPYSDGLAEFSKSWWGSDPGAGVGFYMNKYQLLYAYGGGSEQCVYKGFQIRCGDIGILAVGSAFYEVQNIWAAGANSVDRPRGSTMFFGKPAGGPEIFSNCVGRSTGCLENRRSTGTMRFRRSGARPREAGEWISSMSPKGGRRSGWEKHQA